MIIKSGLIIKEDWLILILNKKKTWEIRSSKTSKRGKIALIKSGSKKIFGTCDLIGVEGPLSKKEFNKNYHKHKVPKSRVFKVTKKYKKIYAWVLKNSKKLNKPIPYRHYPGAVIWVKINKNIN